MRWGWPGQSAKAHVFSDLRSLCGKWLFLAKTDEVITEAPPVERGPDDCAACHKERDELCWCSTTRAMAHETFVNRVRGWTAADGDLAAFIIRESVTLDICLRSTPAPSAANQPKDSKESEK